jgi:phosphoribosylglycinamide formyltransferase-1
MKTPGRILPRIAVFASGNGSNAQRIAEYAAETGEFEVVLICSNNPEAFVLQRAAALGIPALCFDRKQFSETFEVLGTLQQSRVDFIVLAGFLWLVPGYLIKAYPGRIINIHPALLPKYGGKGMYGERVHGAVIASGDSISGITIHLVNERYDEGDIIFQAACPVEPGDTPGSLAERIHKLEHEHYPVVIGKVTREL